VKVQQPLAPMQRMTLSPATVLRLKGWKIVMYHTHWGLSRSPFVGGASPHFYQGESQTEALARLRYAAQERRHSVLLGERGAGKSLLLQKFNAERRDHARPTIILSLAGLSQRELWWNITAGLSLAPRAEEDGLRLFRRLADAAESSGYAPSAVLLLDDAEQAGADVRTQLLRLLGLGHAAWLTVVFTAGLRTVCRLGDELLDVADLRIDLEPWSESDAIGYLQHALVEAGADRPIFEDEALAAIYALTDGIPRRVNRLADHSLLGAAAEGHDMVDAAMVEAAHDAVSWTITNNHTDRSA
jgi:type II secretory pathway predicted ATPase ExeA